MRGALFHMVFRVAMPGVHPSETNPVIRVEFGPSMLQDGINIALDEL